MDNNQGLLTIDAAKKTIDAFRQDIQKKFHQRNFDSLFPLIDNYAVLNQTINCIFRDDVIENILKEIGEKEIGVSTSTSSANKRIVFYDQIGTTICLGLQYLRGLIANGYEILYIFESPSRKVNPSIIKEVQEYCSKILVFEKKSSISLGKKIQSEIEAFQPSKLICHCSADGALAQTIFYSLKNIEIFRIVPGDHHFYIGVGCTDYFFEYRRFAIKVAAEERKIPLEKIYKLPYYPIITSFCDFQGFPKEADGKVVILAAGSEYKFHGSNWFFDTSEWILKHHENAVIIFLGGKSKQIESYVEEKGLKGKFLLVGYRKDFVECMKHADMFLNSYPMGGGLVGLTAINLSKPVISHFDEYNGLQNSIRSFLGAEDIESPISFSNDERLKAYVSQLVNDEHFRMEEGHRMKSMAQTKEKFDEMLGKYLNYELPCVNEVTTVSCHLEKRLESYIALQNDYMPSLLYLLLKSYGISFIFKFPQLRGFFFKHKKVAFGWWLGITAEDTLPQGLYEKIKGMFKKFFI
jgi:hypothetical protein